MTRHHSRTACGRTQTARGAAAAAIALCLFALTACDEMRTDDRPVSDDATFFDEVRSLPAVEDVQLSTDNEDSKSLTIEHPHTVVLAEDADAAALRVTETKLLRLYDDYQYPNGAPHIRLTSGRFTADAPTFDRSSGNSESNTGQLNLADLPNLRALPGVESGSMENTDVSITVVDGTDLREWVTETAAYDGASHLTASAPSATQSSIDITRSFGFTLGTDTAPEAAQTLFDTADKVGATLLHGSVGDGISAPSGDFVLPTTDDIVDLHDVLVTEYGTHALDGFSVSTDDGLEVEFSAAGEPITGLLAAHAQLDAVGADLYLARSESGSIEVEVEDVTELRELVRTVTSATWPLDSDASVGVRHVDAPSSTLRFDAPIWDERVDLVASLWDAGFTAVDSSGKNRGTEFGLTIRDTTGPDYTHRAGCDALVRALRSGGWEGTATLGLSSDENLTFHSTEDGTATHAYNARRGTESKPPDWGQEFLDAWDASAR